MQKAIPGLYKTPIPILHRVLEGLARVSGGAVGQATKPLMTILRHLSIESKNLLHGYHTTIKLRRWSTRTEKHRPSSLLMERFEDVPNGLRKTIYRSERILLVS